jgi:hypothetical protein
MNNWCICWFSRVRLLGISIFKGLSARRHYKSFGVKGLISETITNDFTQNLVLTTYDEPENCQRINVSRKHEG